MRGEISRCLAGSAEGLCKNGALLVIQGPLQVKDHVLSNQMLEIKGPWHDLRSAQRKDRNRDREREEIIQEQKKKREREDGFERKTTIQSEEEGGAERERGRERERITATIPLHPGQCHLPPAAGFMVRLVITRCRGRRRSIGSCADIK